MPDLADVHTADDGTRVYTWDDGRSFPSVTTITGSDPALQRKMAEWAANHPNPDHYRDRQGTLGTIVHHRILNEISIRPLDPPKIDLSFVDDDLRTDVETAIALWEELDLDVGTSPHVEEAIRHTEHEYSGRFDLLTDDGTVVDLKISPNVYDQYRQQASAYFYAIEAMPAFPEPTGAKIVGLNPDPEKNTRMEAQVHHLTRDAIDRHFEDFLDLRRRYDEQQTIS